MPKYPDFPAHSWEEPDARQGKTFNITVIQVYTPTTNPEENDVEWFYDDL